VKNHAAAAIAIASNDIYIVWSIRYIPPIKLTDSLSSSPLYCSSSSIAVIEEEEKKRIFSLKLDTIYLKEKLLLGSYYDEDQTIHLDIAEYPLLFNSSICFNYEHHIYLLNCVYTQRIVFLVNR
jgi:hypothetical protein